MIRVLVVEDDFRVARLHADLVAGVEGMEVLGVAHTAADALAIAAAEHPDLVLLDEYLPDERGTSLIGRLDAAVMLISAETDAGVIRRAVARGAVNVVLKPFGPAVLVGRLAAFRRFWATLESGQADQRAVDRALAVLREGDSPAGAMPKGRSAVTAEAVRDALQAADDALTAQQVADATGVSRATAQRYLADLVSAGRVDLRLRYGSTGRPEHRYTWRG
ncbi:response regulator of citrate/malate metabolism [Marmoricola sp. URHA0025 HA25]